MKKNRIVLTVTDLDEPYVQVWYLKDKKELWDFLNKHARMSGGTSIEDDK